MAFHDAQSPEQKIRMTLEISDSTEMRLNTNLNRISNVRIDGVLVARDLSHLVIGFAGALGCESSLGRFFPAAKPEEPPPPDDDDFAFARFAAAATAFFARAASPALPPFPFGAPIFLRAICKAELVPR